MGGGVITVIEVLRKRSRLGAGDDEHSRVPQKQILNVKVKETLRGVGKGKREAAANSGGANYHHRQLELNPASKLLDMMQSIHFKIVPLKR